MKIKRGAIIESIAINDYAFGGKGIGHIDTEQGTKIVFVEQAIPGQVVKAQITKNRTKFIECRLIKVLQPSEIEAEVAYQQIAGAPYIKLPIDAQHELKERTTIDTYERLAKQKEVRSIYQGLIASPLTFHYRNKMEYSFSSIVHNPAAGSDYDGFALGFKARGTWWKVDPLLKDSGMFDARLENAMPEISALCESTGLAAWHPPKKHGFFRFLVVRKSFAHDNLLINLVTSSQGVERFNPEPLLQLLKGILGERLAGFMHTINDEVNDRGKVESGKWTLHYGQDHIIESICGLDFEISMESFFQPNPLAAEKLYNKVADFVFQQKEYAGDDVIMDLFCGTGTIGQILSKRAGGCRVIGVDIVEKAIINARKNAGRNGLNSAEFEAADAGKYLHLHPELHGKIKTIVLDPPRAGVGAKTMEKVIALGAARIVYVSCNPATQSRDILDLNAAGYHMKALNLVDQFPHTAHIEAVALFDKE